MPILIREIHIKLAVNAPAQQSGNNTPARNTGGANAEVRTDNNRELIIAECVEQVLEILKAKNEP